MRKIRILFIAIFSLLVSISYSQQNSNFSGEWILNLSKSNLQAQWTKDLKNGKVKILHDESNFRYWRNFIIKGIDDTLSFALKIDGQEKIEKLIDRIVISSLSWKYDTLLYITKIIIGKKEAINYVKYYLSKDYSQLITDEKFKGPKMTYHNIWIFEKK